MVFPLKKFFAVLCLGMTVCAPAWGQQINNLGKWAESGFDSISEFGQEVTPTYGQTFRVPDTYDQIADFTFQLHSVSSGDVRFVAYLSEWDVAGGSLTGPLLFSGSTQTLPSGTSAFTPFTFSLSNLLLDPNKTYVAFLSTFGAIGIPSGGSAAMGSPGYAFSSGGGAAVTGGRFVYSNVDTFLELTTSKWELIEANDKYRDAAFVANFSRSSQLVAVPEPATYGLLAALTLGGAVVFRRFRVRTQL